MGSIASRCPRWLAAPSTSHVASRSRDTLARLFRCLTPRGRALPLSVSVRSLCHSTPRIGTTLCWMSVSQTFANKVLSRCWCSNGHFAQDSLALVLVRAHSSRKFRGDMKQRISIGSYRLSGAAAGCRTSARCCECAQCQDQRQVSFDSSRALPSAVMMLVDDESDGHASKHNVWNELLELFVHFTVVPLLAHCLDEPIGIEVAITCHFAMDVCTVIQEDPPPACHTRY